MKTMVMRLWALALVPVTAVAAYEAKPAAVRVVPGGVADADGARGFVANADGGVTALDLESGKELWTAKTAGRPVAVAGGRVLVQTRDKDKANAFRVVGLDVDKGEKAWESDAIVLPGWATSETGVGAGRSFSSRARSDGGALLIGWQADTWYWGGAAPTRQQEAAARKHADGVARVDLDSGKVEMLETAKAPVSDGLRNAAARNYGDGGLTVAVAGDYAVAVDLESANNKQKVVLKRWDLKTEKPLDPVVLTEGAMVYQVHTLPPVGVALVRDATPPPGLPPENWTWTVYDLTTGKETARFPAESRGEDLTVVGPRAYYVVKDALKGPAVERALSQTLKAVDLKTGKRLWEQRLEDERLPPPPPK